MAKTPEEPKSQGWWHTLPGILTATAALVTAVTGLVVALHQAGVLNLNIQAGSNVATTPIPQPGAATTSSTITTPIPQPGATTTSSTITTPIPQPGATTASSAITTPDPITTLTTQPGSTILSTPTSNPTASSFNITIGDIIADGQPAAGAGNIERPGAHDRYTFTATPGQQVFFDMQEHSPGITYIRWLLVDENETEIFNSVLGGANPGTIRLSQGGTYTMIIGSDQDPGTGTYKLRVSQQ